MIIINRTFVRKHKTEIRKLKKELLEIRHTEVRSHISSHCIDIVGISVITTIIIICDHQVPRKGRGFEHESRIMDMNHELRRFSLLHVDNKSLSPAPRNLVTAECQLSHQ